MLNVVCAVLIKDNKIVLSKRSSNLKIMPNMYEFPGGKVEQNETLKQALKRELFEELSININIKDIIEFPNNIVKTNNFKLIVYIVKKWNGKLKINSDVNSEILYVNYDKLQNIDNLLNTNKEVIPYIQDFLLN